MPWFTCLVSTKGLKAACFICLLALLVSACTPRFSVFEEHYESDVEQINEVILIQDVTILSAIARNHYLIHQERSIEALKWVNNSTTDIISKKGYKISDKTVWSVALTFEPDMSVVVFNGAAEKIPDNENITDSKRAYIPTYLDAIGFSDENVSVIQDLHWPLSWLKDEQDWDDIVYPSVRRLKIPVDSVLLVTQSIGVQVPWSAKVGQFFYSMLDDFGSKEYLAMKNALLPPGDPWSSDTSVHLIAVLNHQGKLLWADVYEEIGGNRSEETLRNGLERLFSHLPDHPNSSN